MTHDPRTRDYVAKRTQEGRSYREIRRTFYRQLTTLYATAEPAQSHAAGANP